MESSGDENRVGVGGCCRQYTIAELWMKVEVEYGEAEGEAKYCS